MSSAGFDPAHLGSNAFRQASMLLALFADGDGTVGVSSKTTLHSKEPEGELCCQIRPVLSPLQ
ncbi:hypothetical protein CsSME_00001682 [Camellia sinensis var. sinensis]